MNNDNRTLPLSSAKCDAEFLGTNFTLQGYAEEYIYQHVATSRKPYEAELLELVAFIDLPADGLIVDAGANIGNHTVAFSIAFPNRILAIEPAAINFAPLQRNVEDNGIAVRTDLVQAGLWHHEARLTSTPKDSRNLGMISVSEISGGDIRAVTLDQIVGAEPVALIKIDVEGAEHNVLRGSRAVLERHRPYVTVEAHGPIEYRGVSSFLEQLDYTPILVGGISDNYLFAHTDVASKARARLRMAQERRQLKSNRRLIERVYRQVGEVHARQESLEAQISQTAQETHLRGELEEARRRLADMERRSKAMEAAFRRVSERFELAVPGAWSSRQANATFQKHLHHEYRREEPEGGLEYGIPRYRVRELRRRGTSSNVRIGIATMPGREEGLKTVLSSLSPQADEIMVYLNGMSAIPESLPSYRNVRYFVGPDYGDRAKFLFYEGFDGYYLTCDDDIAYPRHYVAHVIDAIERYGRTAIVGWHGTLFKGPVEDYYDRDSRITHTYYDSIENDTAVHVLGTGVSGLHTSTVPILFEDFRAPNTADVWLALRAQAMSVPMIAVAHGKGWATPLDRHAPSIYNTALSGDTAAVMNVRQLATDAVRRWGRWQVFEPTVKLRRASIAVAIIGRTDPKRWNKGGIFKSNAMIADALRAFDVDVRMFDIHTGDTVGLDGFNPDATIIYVGDPERPDYAKVDRLVELHASQGRLVIVNMSVQGRPERSRLIRDKLIEWNARNPGRVRLMTFTEMTKWIPALDEIMHWIIPMPKTLELWPAAAQFDETSGIFLGDSAKLGDEFLVGGSPHEWIDAIRRSVPEAKLFAVQQYKPRHGEKLDIDEVWPYSSHEFFSRLASMRLMVAPVRHATFEMVPVEAAGMGIPVVYRDMPQSLSEVLALSGVQVESPDELGSILPVLYRDPAVWNSYSRSGSLRAHSQDMRAAAGQLYLHIRRALDVPEPKAVPVKTLGQPRQPDLRGAAEALGYYADIDRFTVPDLVEHALSVRSARMRDVLALRASHSRYGERDLVRVARMAASSSRGSIWRSRTQTWDLDAVAGLARVMAYQRQSPEDLENALHMYTAILEQQPGGFFEDLDEHLRIEAFQHLGRFDDAAAAIADLEGRDHDAFHLALLKANLLNPKLNSNADSTWSAWNESLRSIYEPFGYATISQSGLTVTSFDGLAAHGSAPRTVDGPLVSVIVPTRNGAGTIETAIRSIVGQTWRNIEVIVVDDASDDAEFEELEQIVSKYPEVVLLRQIEPKGSYAARNVALEHVSGQFVTVHDDDDWSHPMKVERQATDLLDHSSDVANMSRQVRAGENLHFLRMYRNASFNMPNFSSLLIRREVFEKIGKWHEVNRGADAEFKDRLVTHFGRSVRVLGGPPLSFMRLRNSSLTGGEIGQGQIDILRRLYTAAYQRAHGAFERRSGSTYWRDLSIPHARGMRPGPKVQHLGSYHVALGVPTHPHEDDFERIRRQIRSCLDAGRNVAVIPLDVPRRSDQSQIDERWLSFLDDGADLLGLRDRAVVGCLVVYGASCLEFLDGADSAISVQRLVILADSDGSDVRGRGAKYDAFDVLQSADRLFGVFPEVYVPNEVRVSSAARDAFGHHLRDGDVSYSDLAGYAADWRKSP